MEKLKTRPSTLLHFPEGEIYICDRQGALQIQRLFVPRWLRRQGMAGRLLERAVRLADRQGREIHMHICPDTQGISEDERREIALGLVRTSSRLGFESLQLDGETYQMERIRHPQTKKVEA